MYSFKDKCSIYDLKQKDTNLLCFELEFGITTKIIYPKAR